jgi:8-oxo-dGTP pyrophosphatase MutT (NUDIX family)
MSSKIKTSGGIVIKENKILFIRKNNRWDLPKGKLEDGVNSRDTALIEISEETGLKKKDLSILKKLIPTHYHKKVDGVMIVKKTYWYLVEYSGRFNYPLMPDENEGITDCRWFSFDELVLVLEESHERIRYLVEFFLHMPFYKKYRSDLKIN